MQDEIFKKWITILEALDTPSREDLHNFVLAVAKLIKEHENGINIAFSGTKNQLESLSKKERADLRALVKSLNGLDTKLKKAHEQERKKLTKELESMLMDARVLLNSIPDIAYFEQKVAEIPELDSPEAIRDKLETLEGDERLTIDAIKNLREELDKLISSRSSSGTPAIAFSRGSIRLYDLSGSLDGVTKTFALPAFWQVLTVQSSSFPNALRPVVDYTVNPSTSQITFTSEIEASTTLANGQTLTILYAEP